jgi:NADH-quinone oxidoreductase subunit N
LNDLGLILPEIILLIGGLLVFSLDVVSDPKAPGKRTGASYMALSILFLGAALLASMLQLKVTEPQVAYGMMTIDSFAMFIKVTILAGMVLVAIAGGGYMNKRTKNQGEFWTFFVLVSLAMSVAASANNLVLIYIAIEFLSITSYMLAGFLRDDRRSNEAGLKYFLYGSVASAVMLYGISLLYGATGSLYLADIGAFFASAMEGKTEMNGIAFVALPATILTLAGLGFKASLAPFYQWAPDTFLRRPRPQPSQSSPVSFSSALPLSR